MRWFAWSALLALACSSGCKSSKASKCEQVVDKKLKLMGDQMKNLPPEAADKVKQVQGLMKKTLIEECTKIVDDKVLDCILASNSPQEMDKCN